MDRKAQSLHGASKNPNLYLSGEETAESDYSQVAAGAEMNMSATPGHKFQAFPVAVYWLILLVVIPLHVYIHSNLMRELHQVKKQNHEFEGEKETLKEQIEKLKEQIEKLKETQNELNVSRAQWSIDSYCPKRTNGRKCKPCQYGWATLKTSCYGYNNEKVENQRNWDKAREDCRGKGSDLTAATNEEEKGYINGISPKEEGIIGYWIGLRADQGKWKWIDGTELSNQGWIEGKATDGQCVTALQGEQWRSVSCKEKNAWICGKKALSVD